MSAIVAIEPHTISHLRLRLWVYIIFCLALLGAGFLLMRLAWEPLAALRWMGLSALGMGVVVWRFWSAIGDNYRPGENHLLPDLGPGNVISLGRGALIASLFGFLFAPWPPGWLAWLPGIIYTIAALLDGVDGAAARLSNHVTRLGETLDISFDSLGTLVVTALLAQYGQVSAWFVLLGLARYLFLAGMWLRRRLGLPLYDLLPSNSRRMIAGLTFGFTFALLWPILRPPATLWAAAFWAIPFLGGFLLDWLVVSGVLKPSFSTSISRFTRLASTWLPIFFRISAVLLTGYGLIQYLMKVYSIPYLNPWQYFLANSLVWLQVAVALVLALGLAVRSFSFVGLFLLGLVQLYTPLDLAQRFLIYTYISLVFLGGGLYSLWRPEDRLIEHRIGERQA